MLLVFDVGNTNIVLGVFDGKEIKTHFRISTSYERTCDEYGHLICSLLDSSSIKPKNIDAVIMSTVVPPITDTLREMTKKFFNCSPMFVDPGIKTGLNIRYENPKEVGADRIVNAVAGFHLYGGPLVIVDFGTATTFCAISKNGEYLGGAISPGIIISVEALFKAAARLSRVELKKPAKVIGKNTIESMQSGIIFGFVGQVDELVRRISAEMEETPKIIATGGLAHLISAESKTIQEVCPLLTLEGLKIIYDRNKNT